MITEVAGQYCRATWERWDASNRSDPACDGVADEPGATDWLAAGGGV
ncbi:MAG TPA: hypothetical protein VMG38_16650 [Trebonia sp.]|nr:hypothetical protein [Trebonia sp.]